MAAVTKPKFGAAERCRRDKHYQRSGGGERKRLMSGKRPPHMMDYPAVAVHALRAVGPHFPGSGDRFGGRRTAPSAAPPTESRRRSGCGGWRAALERPGGGAGRGGGHASPGTRSATITRLYWATANTGRICHTPQHPPVRPTSSATLSTTPKTWPSSFPADMIETWPASWSLWRGDLPGVRRWVVLDGGPADVSLPGALSTTRSCWPTPPRLPRPLAGVGRAVPAYVLLHLRHHRTTRKAWPTRNVPPIMHTISGIAWSSRWGRPTT